MTALFYDRSGNPISLEGWSYLFAEDRSVGMDKINANEYVSTVWMGLDHSLALPWYTGEPLIFETMIFGGKFNQELWRYATEEEAKEGHERIVRELKLGADPTAVRDESR
jgi:hypothetical protein